MMLDREKLPEIIVGESDFRSLQTMALAGTSHTAEESDALLYEMDRASVVPDPLVPPDIIRMGSIATIRMGGERVMDVTLVYPGKADISAGRVSIMTPLGTALIGLRTGQSMRWIGRDGRKQSLTVLKVRQAAPA